MNKRQKKKFKSKCSFKTYKRVKECIHDSELEFIFARLELERVLGMYCEPVEL